MLEEDVRGVSIHMRWIDSGEEGGGINRYVDSGEEGVVLTSRFLQRRWDVSSCTAAALVSCRSRPATPPSLNTTA